MKDTELFELCQDVYKRTGWHDTKEAFYRKGHYFYSDGTRVDEGEPEIEDNVGTNVDFPYELLSPLYTSDYLLEKLPPALWIEVSGEGKQVALLAVNMQGNGEAIAVYELPYDKEFRGSYSNRADTPLKALLKLVIALVDDGHLKKEEQ